jgi:diacylglycerol kinase family enzyme
MSAPPSPSEAAAFGAAAAARRLFVVLNAGSGPQEGAEKRQVLMAALQATGLPWEFVPVLPRGIVASCRHAARMAAQAGGVLVAAGGDGTVNCAAQAALQAGCSMAIVPMGTFNLFAREHGVPLDAAEAVAAIASAQEQPVQVGLVNEHVFLANAAVGLYPKLLEDREAAKQQLGQRRRWIAIAAGMKTLFEWRLQLRLDAELDGRVTRLRTPSLFVCNNRVQLERVGIDEAVVAQVGEGRLAGLMAHPLDAWAKLKLLVRGIAGTLGDAREVDSFTLRTLTVTTRAARRIKVATDGEVQWMALPLRFAVGPQALRLLVPVRAADGGDAA